MENALEIWNSFETNLKTLLVENIKSPQDIINKSIIEINEAKVIYIFSLDYLDLSNRKEEGRTVSYNNLILKNSEFLKFFPNLKYLNLCGQHSLKNLNGFSYCKNLIELNAAYIALENLDHFNYLTSLKSLNLHCSKALSNQRISLKGLANLKLTKLNLTLFPFEDISPLNNILSLKELSLYNTSFQDLIQIRNLINLEILVCCGYTKLSPLKFPNLKYLYISNSRLKGVEEFKKTNPQCSINHDLLYNIYKCNARLDYFPRSKSLVELDKRLNYLEKLCYNEKQSFPKTFIPYDFFIDPTNFKKLIIPIPQKASFSMSTKGRSEIYFLKFLKAFFADHVSNELHFVLGKWLPKVPDFTLAYNEEKIYIDIEIDEPYSLTNDSLFHHDGIDSDRNFTFIHNNWFVIRFTEEQVIKYPNDCCLFIQQFKDYLVEKLDGRENIWENKFKYPTETWTEELLKIKKNEKYRELYLDTLK